jgi:hypothetical protein
VLTANFDEGADSNEDQEAIMSNFAKGNNIDEVEEAEK